MQTTTYKLDITPGGVPLTIHISQYDVGLRQYIFQPYTSVGEFTYVSGATVTLEATKPDGYAVIHECTYNQDGSITYTVQEQLAAVPGRVWSKVVIRDGADVLGTGAVLWIVDYAGVKDDAIFSDSDISGLEGYVDQLKTLVSTPIAVTTAAGMTDHEKLYLYEGSETGYTAGNWYYWNGSAWASGGQYGGSSVEVDPTLSIAGMAADAKVTGDGFTRIENDMDYFGDINLIPLRTANVTTVGVSFAWNRYTVTVTGRASSGSYYNLYENRTALPKGMVAGGTYHIRYDSENLVLRVYAVDGSNNATQIYSAVRGGSFTIPAGTVGIMVRFNINSGREYNATLTAPFFFNSPYDTPNIVVDLYHDYPRIAYNAVTKTYTVSINSTVRTVWNDGVKFGTNRANAVFELPPARYLAYSVDDDNFYIGVEPSAGTILYNNGKTIAICLYNTNGHLSGQWVSYYANEKVNEVAPATVPAYYDTHLTTKVDSINTIALGLSRQSARFFFITDYHRTSNVGISPALIYNIIGKTGIKKVVMGGDNYNSDETALAALDELNAVVKAFNPISAVADVYYITGNHEYNNPSSNPEYLDRMLTIDTLYQLFNVPAHGTTNLPDTNTFFLDDDASKIRYYFFDCESDSAIGTEARHNAFTSMLDTPEGYAVFVFSHKGLTDDNSAIYVRMGQIMGVCAALNDGTSYTINYTDIGSKTYDFTGKARTFIGALSGHTHLDGYVYYDGRFPVIATACDAYDAQTSHPERVAGGVLEQCFEVAQIDVPAKRIYLTRIGYGSDRTFSFGDAGSGLIT